MNRRTLVAVVLAGVLFVGISAAAFFGTHERREVEVREPPVGEARSNRFLALERLWTRYGHAVESVASRTEAPVIHSTAVETQREFDVVVLGSPDTDVPADQLDAWVKWVSLGGTLITTVSDESAPTSLLRAFDFADDQVELRGDPAGPTFEVSEPPWRHADRMKGWAMNRDRLWTADDGTVVAVEREIGSGKVILLHATSVFSNARIGDAEHAEYAVELMPEGGAVVLIVRHPARISWVAEVVERTWPILVGVVLLLLFAVQAGRVRFGPMIPPPSRDRRRRLEHVEAVGRFLWKNGESAMLADATRQALFADLRRRRRLARRGGDPTAEELAEALEIPLAEAREVLRDPRPKPTEFVTWIRQIETYRRTL